MVCKITSIERVQPAPRASSGFLLAEAVIAIGITCVMLAVLASISMLGGRTFMVFANYVELDDNNRIAMDTLTRDLRECNRITAWSTNSLSIEDPDGSPIVYFFSAGANTLTRTKNGASKVLLTGCDALTFSIAYRVPMEGSYDLYPCTDPADAKVVNVDWNCSRTIFGRKANTENVQGGRIFIRRQDA